MKKIAVFLALMLIGVTNCYAKEMEVKENVNIITFDIDTTYNGIAFKIYNEDNGEFIERIYISERNMTYSYAKGLNIRLVDDSVLSSYEKIKDIILHDESKILNFERTLRIMKVTIKTIYRDYVKTVKSVETGTNVTIYDENFNELLTCENAGDCIVNLKVGAYYFKDNKFGYMSKEKVTNDRNVFLSRYFIDGIISEEELDLENVTRHGNVYYFNEQVYPDDVLTINGEECVMADKSKYYYIFLDGIFYKYSKKDEVINDDFDEENNSNGEDDINNSKDNNEDKEKTENNLKEELDSNKENEDDIISEDEILIDIPNTEVSNFNIIYFKKKYYFE